MTIDSDQRPLRGTSPVSTRQSLGPRASVLEPVPTVRATRCAVGLVIFVATLPLQWQAGGATPFGVLRYHHLGALAMIVVAWPPGEAYRHVLRRLHPLPTAFVTLTIVGLATAVTWQGRPVNYTQTALYAVIGLVAAAALLTAFQTERSRRILTWTAPSTVVVFIVFYYVSARQAGVDPVAELVRGVQTADAVRMQVRLFTAVFRGADEAARGNMRHEVMAALVVAGAISMGAAAVCRRPSRLANLALLVIVAICLVSLSRSILLALGLTLLPVVVRIVSNSDLTPARFYALFVAALTLPLAVGVAATLLLARLEDTRSYDARLIAFDLTPRELLDRALFGGSQLPESTHTLIFDALFEGSWIAFVAATVMVVVMIRLATTAGSRYLETGSALPLAIVMALAVIIVRAFTAGGGQIAGPGWLALALAAAGHLYLESSGSDEDEALDGSPADSPSRVPERSRARRARSCFNTRRY